MHFRIPYKVKPKHTHMTVFIGEGPELTHANAGNLCMTNEEFEEFKLIMATSYLGRREVQFVDETPEERE